MRLSASTSCALSAVSSSSSGPGSSYARGYLKTTRGVMWKTEPLAPLEMMLSAVRERKGPRKVGMVGVMLEWTLYVNGLLLLA